MLLLVLPVYPEGPVRPQETATGATIGRAWHTTTDRTDVLLSVMDAGIDWAHEGIIRKTALNTATFPDCYPEVSVG